MKNSTYAVLLLTGVLFNGCQPSDMNDTQPSPQETKSQKQIPWPAPNSEQNRFIINLPTVQNSQSNEVELIIGKDMKVDTCNQFFFGGSLQKETLQGWGYDYYVAKPTGMTGTRRACLDNKQVTKFVQMHTRDNMKVRYNSKLPIVVYAPKDFKVSYKLWTQDNTLHTATAK